MPPLTLHIGVAMAVIPQIQEPLLENNLGEYLFGATAPDARYLTGIPREETHFFPLDRESHQGSVRRFFQAKPHLKEGGRLWPPQRAFIAGYLSHLVVDELWIQDIYRPYFGKDSPLLDSREAALWDRALQFELEQREHPGVTANLSALIGSASAAESLGLIEVGTLGRWRRLVAAALSADTPLERYRLFAQNFPKGRFDIHDIESFLEAFPSIREQVLRYVPTQAIAAFRENCVVRSAAVIRGYLVCTKEGAPHAYHPGG